MVQLTTVPSAMSKWPAVSLTPRPPPTRNKNTATRSHGSTYGPVPLALNPCVVPYSAYTRARNVVFLHKTSSRQRQAGQVNGSEGSIETEATRGSSRTIQDSRWLVCCGGVCCKLWVAQSTSSQQDAILVRKVLSEQRVSFTAAVKGLLTQIQ